MERYLIVHYSEIGLKKGNIEYFLNKLHKSLKLKLEKNFKIDFSIKHTLGRFLIKLPKIFDENKYCKVLEQIFGVKNFKFTFIGSIKLNTLNKQIFKNLPEDILSENALKTFRVSVKRSMNLPYKSVEAEGDLGAYLLKNGLKMKVDLDNPEFVVDVEFFNNKSFFSFKKYKGSGGLPPNSQGKLISLISSGIDSPVASYKMMKRGARVIFAHFTSYPYTDSTEKDNVQKIVKILSEYQFDTKLYIVSFGDIQKSIYINVDIPAKIRTVLYRRMMLRIAEYIAHKEKAKGLITGDNLGQVASQTPENLFAIHQASQIPIYQPLISFDKEEIIELAEKIETFNISKIPCKDSCSTFSPKHPELKANFYDVVRLEEKLPINDWIQKSFKEAKIINF